MTRIALTHPDLPGQVIRIDETRIAARLGAGWEIATESSTPVEPAPKPRRRRKPEEN